MTVCWVLKVCDLVCRGIVLLRWPVVSALSCVVRGMLLCDWSFYIRVTSSLQGCRLRGEEETSDHPSSNARLRWENDCHPHRELWRKMVRHYTPSSLQNLNSAESAKLMHPRNVKFADSATLLAGSCDFVQGVVRLKQTHFAKSMIEKKFPTFCRLMSCGCIANPLSPPSLSNLLRFLVLFRKHFPICLPQ